MILRGSNGNEPMPSPFNASDSQADPEGEAAAVQGREAAAEEVEPPQRPHSPAPASEAADSGGQPNGDSERLGRLKAAIRKPPHVAQPSEPQGPRR